MAVSGRELTREQLLVLNAPRGWPLIRFLTTSLFGAAVYGAVAGAGLFDRLFLGIVWGVPMTLLLATSMHQIEFEPKGLRRTSWLGVLWGGGEDLYTLESSEASLVREWRGLLRLDGVPLARVGHRDFVAVAAALAPRQANDLAADWDREHPLRRGIALVAAAVALQLVVVAALAFPRDTSRLMLAGAAAVVWFVAMLVRHGLPPQFRLTRRPSRS